VRDPFVDKTNGKQYGVVGYKAVNPEDFSLLPSSRSGYYVTTMQMHDDWAYLTRSFSTELFTRQEAMYRQDTLNMALVELISSKDSILFAWQEKVKALELLRASEQSVLSVQSDSLLSNFNRCTEGVASMTLMLDAEKKKKENWIGLSISAVFLGFLIGMLVK